MHVCFHDKLCLSHSSSISIDIMCFPGTMASPSILGSSFSSATKKKTENGWWSDKRDQTLFSLCTTSKCFVLLIMTQTSPLTTSSLMRVYALHFTYKKNFFCKNKLHISLRIFTHLRSCNNRLSVSSHIQTLEILENCSSFLTNDCWHLEDSLRHTPNSLWNNLELCVQLSDETTLHVLIFHLK